MTISSLTTVTRTNTNGSSHTFNFGHPFQDPDDLLVYLVTIADWSIAPQTKDTHYTVSSTGDEDENGGTITFIDGLGAPSAPASGKVCVILRKPPLIQDFNPNGSYPSRQGEEALDRVYQVAQFLQYRADRSIRLNDAYADADLVLPDATTRAGKALIFDDDGDLTVGDTAADNLEDIEAAQAATEAAATAAQGYASTATTQASAASTSAALAQDWAVKINGIVNGEDYSSKAWAIGGTNVTSTANRGAAKEWATKVSGLVDTDEGSAKAYALGGTGVSATSGRGAAKEWATKTSAAVDTAEFSAKAYAVGGTGVTSAAGAAKEWATLITGAVNGGGDEFSAKAWAIGGTGVTDTASRGAAKEWATKAEDSTVDGTNYSALHWAAKAAASAASISTEAMQDLIGAMVGGNTESGISVSYQDSDGTLDFEVQGVLATLFNLGQPANDGEFLVATGAGALGWESGATARASLGVSIGSQVQAFSAILAATTASFLTAHETKLGHITVTQAVDLDAIESRVNDLDASVVLRGTWDASSGSFPGGGTAQAGDSYIVSVGGTVDSVVFAVGDRIIAITDNASTSTFAANWFKADYTDLVSSVAGKTGVVTLQVADITDMHANGRSLVATDYAGMRALLDLEAGTDFLTPAAIAAAYQPLDATLTDLAALSDPNADRGLFWDDSESSIDYWAAANGLEFSGTNLQMTAAQRTRTLLVTIGDGVNTITTGTKGYAFCDVAGTITGWRLVGDASGSIVIDVWKESAGNVPDNSDTIAGSEKPTLSTAQINSDTSLSTWTTAVAAGDTLGFEVESATTVKQVTLAIRVLVT